MLILSPYRNIAGKIDFHFFRRFDVATGNLWLGDVGQDAREEVDIVANGAKYGWRLMEGFLCTPGLNPSCQDTAGLLRSVWDFPNLSGSGNDGSITGGYVYRGSAIPSLYGKYIFSDFISGKTRALTFDGISNPSVMPLSDESYLISTFGTDAAGNLFLCSYGSSGRQKSRISLSPAFHYNRIHK